MVPERSSGRRRGRERRVVTHGNLRRRVRRGREQVVQEVPVLEIELVHSSRRLHTFDVNLLWVIQVVNTNKQDRRNIT